MVEKNTELATKKGSALQTLATRLQVNEKELETLLKTTVFMVKDGDKDRAPTNEEFIALVAVANTYKLNPILKELYAFLNRGRVIPIVPIDGWISLVNRSDKFDGVELIENNDPADHTKLVSVTAKFYLKDTTHPTVVTEYMAECAKDTTTWKKWPRRMLRHKAYTQGARIAFGFSGIYEEDEAERIVEGETVPAAFREMPQALPEPAKPAEHPSQAPLAPVREMPAVVPADAEQPAGAEEATEGQIEHLPISKVLTLPAGNTIPATLGVYSARSTSKTMTGKTVHKHTLQEPTSEAVITISTWAEWPAAKPGDLVKAIDVLIVALKNGNLVYSAKSLEVVEIGMAK